MGVIVTQNTTTEVWQNLVHAASSSCDRVLDEELESYLVFMLMRHTACMGIVDNIVATQYLQGMQSAGNVAAQQLQEVGDQCLLYSGFFPKQSERRLVKVRYYVDLGRSAYSHISDKMKQGTTSLYERLARYFVALMDILQAMRCLDLNTGQDCSELIEYAQDCCSERAIKILSEKNIRLIK